MKKKGILTALSCFAAAAASPASATPLDYDCADHIFDSIDTNASGYISEEEWQVYRAFYPGMSRFAEVDRNGDGMISRGEYYVWIENETRPISCPEG